MGKKAQLPNGGTPLILFIVLIIIFVLMCISFGSFTSFGCFKGSCGYFLLPPILGLVACVCGIIGILCTNSLLMFITAIAAVILCVLHIIAFILVFVDFANALGSVIFPLIVYILAALMWGWISSASWNLKKSF